MQQLDSTQQIDAIVARHAGQPGPLLPVLHDVQDALGCIPPEAVPLIAAALNLSRADVHGVVTFYHYFRQHPPGRRILQICRAEACQSVGGEDLEEHAQRRLGVGFGGTTADGAFTLEPVFCLGNCAAAPSAMLDGRLYGRLSPAKLDRLIDGTAGT